MGFTQVAPENTEHILQIEKKGDKKPHNVQHTFCSADSEQDTISLLFKMMAA